MDKNTLSNYGWIVIAVLVLSVMIALATPFGEYIKAGVESTTQGLFDTSEKALNVVGMTGTTPTISVLDSGKCGDNLTWELRSNGELRISGTGPMYDYVKFDAVKQSPWYKYRDEPYISDDGTQILNLDGSVYNSTTSYLNDNPNGWKIKNIVIEPGVTRIGNWAFYRVCVDELTIPEGVEEMGYFSVRYSQKLKTLNLPDSLVLLDDFAVSRNAVLKTINFGDSLETVGLGGFQNNDALTTAILPDSVKEVNVRQHETHTAISSETDNLGLFEGCKSLENVYLGNIYYIPQRTFLNCHSLESIVIPNTVEYIEEYAFGNCESLKTVIFEEGSQCTTIKTKAFINAINIESITGCTVLETIEGNAFTSLENLKEFEFSDSNIYLCDLASSKIETATVGPNMQFKDYLFQNCTSLKEIYISSNVTEFGANSLRQCTSLENIYYDGTRTQWDAITKGNNWCYLTPNAQYGTVVHFSDGTTDTLANCK